jgi:DNA mismatch repair protein MSH2
MAILIQHSGKHIRFFERPNDNYSVHGKDAEFVAEHLFKTSKVLKYFGSKTTPSCSISKPTALVFLRELLTIMGYRVEIWEMVDRQFVLSKQASPGNLLEVEDLLFENSDGAGSLPIVAAVNIETRGDQTVVGVAFTDASSGMDIIVSEFIDNETFSNLESSLIQHSVKECVISDENRYELDKIKKLLDRCEIVTTEVKKGFPSLILASFKTANLEQDLDRLLESELSITSYPEYELKIAMGSVACLLCYLKVLFSLSVTKR